MGTKPGLLLLTKRILGTAAAGLENLVHDAATAPRVERAMVTAHERLGALYRNVNLDLSLWGDAPEFAGDLAVARATADESRIACEAEFARDGASMQKRFELTNCHARLRSRGARMERFTDAAKWAANNADLARHAEADPNNPKPKREEYDRLRATYETAAHIGQDDPSAQAAQPPQRPPAPPQWPPQPPQRPPAPPAERPPPPQLRR